MPPAAITPFVVNGHTLSPFANTEMARALAGCEDVQGRTLVLIQMKGGNDGVNTVIPINQYDQYATLRPGIRIADTGAQKFIELDATLSNERRVGLHPAMKEVKEMYDKGLVSIVQGVSYEQPNQSHFKSTDLWFSGGDGTQEKFNITSGWMGRSVQAMFPDVKGVPTANMPDPLGIQVGDPNPSLGFHTETEHRIDINLSGQDPAGFYSLVQTIGGAPILDVPQTEHGEELEYIMSVEQSVSKYAKRISDTFNAGKNVGTYPNSNLANQLKTIARLIRGGSKTKIFLCTIGGFDTHNAQTMVNGSSAEGTHAELLGSISQAIKAFYDDLEAMSIAGQVVGCTFSEFGRTARQNGSTGTDHGTLAPMFIFGKTVKGGVNGNNVNLSNLTRDNQLQGMQHDYRQVFSTLLQDWLGASDSILRETLFDGFVKLPLLSAAHVADPGCYYGGATTSTDSGVSAAGLTALQLFPNPARYSAEIAFTADSHFPARLSLHSLGGQLAYSGNVPVQPGDNVFHLDVANHPAGMYIVRMENRNTGKAEVAKLQIVK